MREIHQKAIVGQDGSIRITSRELPPPGTTTEVVVVYDETSIRPPSLSSLFGSAKGLFASPEEVDSFIRDERDSWAS